MALQRFLDASALRWMSFFNTLRPFNSVAVLMYHNITDDVAPSYRSIRVQDFRDQMRYLKEKCEVLSIADLAKIYTTSKVLPKTSKPRVVITLDDGFRDNYLNAFPILNSFGLPAACFVVSKFVRWTDDDRDPAKSGHLSFREMKEMRNNGVTFCSHTHSHPNLTKLAREEQQWEIEKGMVDLYERFSDPEVLAAFAYPFGEYNEDTLSILKQLNFRIGFGVWHHLNGSMENPLRLKRLTADGRDCLFKFAGQLNPYVFQVYQKYLARKPAKTPYERPSLAELNSFVFEI